MKILGREPALWLGLVAALVKLASAFWWHVTPNQQAVINTVAFAVVGVVIAFVTRDGIGAAVMNFIHAAVAAAVGFGLDWSADKQAVVFAFVAALVAAWTRTQVRAPVSSLSQPAPPAGV